MGNLIDYATDHGVALVTLNDPPVNALTHEMLTELDSCVTDARFDDGVQVVVITGRGEHSFSAGINLHMLREVDASFRYNLFLSASELFTRLERTPKLVIAALNGHTMGAGLELALACDLRVARRGDGLLCLPQIELGMMPAAGGTQRLARLVGKGRAMQLVLEATRLTVDEALQAGIINHVWDTTGTDSFLDQTLTYARGFTLPSKASLAVGRIKRAIQAAFETSLDQGLALEKELDAHLCASTDAAEGLAAWTEKREPSFEGK